MFVIAFAVGLAHPPLEGDEWKHAHRHHRQVTGSMPKIKIERKEE
jgi:hypothetical protein